MTLHIGDDNIVDIRKGDTKIAKVYHGSDLVWGYVPGKLLFESSTPGTYTLYVKCRCKLDIILVGGGGGGAESYYVDRQYNIAQAGGGSGSYVHGIVEVFAGRYSVVVGNGGVYGGSIHAGVSQGGKGGNSSFAGQIAGGGEGGTTWYINTQSGTRAVAGAGGVASTTAQYTNGNPGGAQYNQWGYQPQTSGGASVYNGYGIGGNDHGSGTGGYAKIVTV